MPEEPDIIDEELADEEPVSESNEGLSDESREAIQKGADRLVNGKKNVASEKAEGGQAASGESSPQPQTPTSQPSNSSHLAASNDKKSLSGSSPQPKTPPTPPPTGGPKPPTGSAAGTAGKVGQALQAGRVGADIAAHPKEGAEEAGHAVAHQAGKRVATEIGEAAAKNLAEKGAKTGAKVALKTAAEGAAELATSETVIIPAIIAASDFIIGKMANLPGAKGVIGWINKHKILVAIFVVFLFCGAPVLALIAGASSGDCDSSSTETAGSISVPTATDQALIGEVLANTNIAWSNATSKAEVTAGRVQNSTLQLLLAAAQAGYKPNVTSAASGGHTTGSFHYSGLAFDFAPNNDLQKFLYAHAAELKINELFGPLDGQGGPQIDSGQQFNGVIANHKNHIHVATYQ